MDFRQIRGVESLGLDWERMMEGADKVDYKVSGWGD